MPRFVAVDVIRSLSPSQTCKNTSCKHEFCWVCSGPWKDHSGSYYNCNKYDPEKDKESADGKKKDSSRAALERYLHYYTRFTNHHNSLKFEIEAKTKMEQKIKEMEARASLQPSGARRAQRASLWLGCGTSMPGRMRCARVHACEGGSCMR